MGLTGIILRATFRMIPVATAMIRRDAVRARNLEHAMELFEASSGWTYTVAWIDCLAHGDKLGRSILFRGEHAKLDEIPEARRRDPLSVARKRTRRVPPLIPPGLLNRWSVSAFNEIYYRQATLDSEVVEIDEFFYPLDGLTDWFRLYGPAGFIQYQCVLPKMAGRAGMAALLERISQSGLGSFLGVLKLFGAQDGLMSFPMEGYTLALDFPVTSQLRSLTRELDAIVREHRGRIYLAKDSCSAPDVVAAGYPRLSEFRKLRTGVDPEGKFNSVQALRLGL
jgi:decaprenylphospho-beta-D-ribofuranose 2-oxidase